MEGQATIHINAAPDDVYALVSDITRMGEWSPETVACEWVDGATGPAVGAKFKGTNKLGPVRWSTTPTVTDAVPGKSFVFSTGSTEWRYSFIAADEGTSVTESFTVTSNLTKLYTGIAPGRVNKMKQGMMETLTRIKQAAEASAS